MITRFNFRNVFIHKHLQNVEWYGSALKYDIIIVTWIELVLQLCFSFGS